MKTRSGARRIPPFVSTSSSSKIRKKVTEDRMDDIISKANAKHKIAVSVDGVEALLWRKMRAGDFCTCHGNDQADDSVRVLDEDEDFVADPEETVGDVLSGATPSQWDVVNLRDDEEYLRSKENYENFLEFDVETDQYEDVYADSADEFDVEEDYSLQTKLLEEQELETADEKAQLQRSVISLLTGGLDTACGICFSTGWTEGYQLQNGRRWPLNTHDIYDLGGFTVNTTVFPNTIEGFGGCAPVIFKVDFPSYFRSAAMVRIMNNLRQAGGLTAFVKWPEASDYVPLTVLAINSRNGMNNVGTLIKIEVSKTNIEFKPLFTHLEIIIEYTDRPKVQMPNIDSMETWELTEAIVTSNMEWPASVQEIPFGSVVVESKYRRAWRINTVTTQRTSKGQIWTHETQIEKIQQFEPTALLNLYRGYQVILKNFKGFRPTV